MIVDLVCGARPNFMKVGPLYHALKRRGGATPRLVHTGQHYDSAMSGSILKDLRLPDPDVFLGVGSGTHAQQTAKVMIEYEGALQATRPDLVVVVGDVNSTVAATLTAAKLGIRVAHLEAGLRSFDRTMPEELNRVVTDALADDLWVPSQDGVDNLLAEGVAESRIHLVGNIMIDAFEMLSDAIRSSETRRTFGFEREQYGVVTLHRPANVDSPDVLSRLCTAIADVARLTPLIFPVHPRTRARLEATNAMADAARSGRLILCEPLSYVPFMSLVVDSELVITDSGGIQEETTYLGVPCLTLRPNTERPVTVTHGTNRLCTEGGLLDAAAQAIDEKRACPLPGFHCGTAGRPTGSRR